jgi:hypothetical protein
MLKKILFISGSVSAFLLSASAVLAEDYGQSATAQAAGLNKYSGSLPTIAGNVIGAGLSLIGAAFFVLMVYAGVIWMTARGKEEQTKKALDTIIAAAIGIIIVLASYALTRFVFGSII